MEPFPHQYTVSASSESTSLIKVSSAGMPDLITGPPKEFGGSGEEWSPEDLLVASVVDCYILSFKAVAKASRLDWISIECNAVGTLENAFCLVPQLPIPRIAIPEFIDQVNQVGEAANLLPYGSPSRRLH